MFPRFLFSFQQQQQQGDISVRNDFVVTSFSGLVGLEAVWLLCLKAGSADASREALDLLVALYTNVRLLLLLFIVIIVACSSNKYSLLLLLLFIVFLYWVVIIITVLAFETNIVIVIVIHCCRLF
jgi:hypothetical protein